MRQYFITFLEEASLEEFEEMNIPAPDLSSSTEGLFLIC
jgi:hypothetical protein